MCSSSIGKIRKTTSGYLECGLGWFRGGLGCFGVVWGVSTDRKKCLHRKVVHILTSLEEK